MGTTVAFDVYGTLIDTAGVTRLLADYVDQDPSRFAAAWRDKQLEYSFRRGLMGQYQDFGVCTRQALEFTARQMGVALASDQQDRLMAAYRELPAFPDVAEGLEAVAEAGHRLFAFSNGPAAQVRAVLDGAGIGHRFLDVISVDEIRRFKPDPSVYAHFLQRAGVDADEAWLVSGNPFDVIGALAAGLRGAWLRRSDDAVFDPWEWTPSATLRTLHELVPVLGAAQR